MKVFVTGASGFIGRVLVGALIKRGDEVIALLRKPGHNLPKGIGTVYGDILAVDSWQGSVKGCRRLYHLAGMVSFNPRMRRQLLAVNGTGTANVLTLASRYDIESTVVVSSACTMGLSYSPQDVRNEESGLDLRLIARNPYLESKLVAEKEAQEAARLHKVVIVNPTTVYGPGDWTLNSGALIKQIASAKVQPVPPGGSNVIDVEDAAEGIACAAEHGISGERYILGGENLPFGEIFSTVARAVGKKPIFIPLPRFMRLPLSLAAGAIGMCTASRFLTAQIVSDLFDFKYYSSALAEERLKFKARFRFSQTIERAWDFYRQNKLI